MEQVYVLLSVCCKKEGATKSQIFDAMKFFKVEFKEKDWRKLMRLNKYECDLFFKDGKWFCYDYCSKRYVQHILEKDDDFMGFSMSLPYFYTQNRANFRNYFSITQFP